MRTACRVWLLACSTTMALAGPLDFSRLPLAFEQSPGGRWVARGNGYVVSVQGGGAEIGFLDSDKSSKIIAMQFSGGGAAQAEASDRLPGKVNYYLGNDPKKWRTGLATYGRVTWRGIYPGIDVAWYGNQQQVEFDFLLAPGADPGRIRLRFSGADRVELEKDEVVLHTAAGDVRLPLPAIYQEGAGGKRRPIGGHYTLLPGHDIGFRLDSYDRTRPLTIDPSIVYAGLFGGGTGATTAYGVAADSTNNVYIAGATMASDLPAAGSLHQAPDGFVAKINSTGTEILWATYIGGDAFDLLTSVTVDSNGNPWVAGYTYSTDFPTLNAYQPFVNGTEDAVIAQFSSAGQLTFATYYGGGGNTGQANGIAADQSGNVYVAGQGRLNASSNEFGFVASFNASGGLNYGTLIEGSGNVSATAIAVDSSGNAYLGANSGESVLKVNSSGTIMNSLTLPGNGTNTVTAIAVQGSNVYLAGHTTSTNLPTTTGALQQTFGTGSQHGFLAQLSTSNVAQINMLTYFGGNRSDSITGVALDSNGDVYLTGFTNSSTFPNSGGLQPLPAGNETTLFHTANNTTWSSLDSNLGDTATYVTPDPSTEGILVVVGSQGIYRTTNSGSSWTLTLPGSFSLLSRSLANGQYLYAYNGSTIYQSTNGGATWNSGNAAPAAVVMVADAFSAGAVYLANDTSTVQISTNGGTSWTALSTGFPAYAAESLIVTAEDVLYLDSGDAYVYTSANQGASWASVSSGLVCCGTPHGLTVIAGIQFYRSSGSALYVSSNAGTSWAPVSSPLPGTTGPVALVKRSTANEGDLYATTLNPPGVYYTSNGGTSWTRASGFGLAVPTYIEADPLNTGNAYAAAAVSSSGFWTALGPGATNIFYSTFLGGPYTYPLGIAVAGSNILVAGQATSLPEATASWSVSNGQTNAFLASISGSTPACSVTFQQSGQQIIVTSAAQSVTLGVEATSGCSWTATDSDSFATLIPASGAGSGVLTVEVTANTTGASRTTNVFIGAQSVQIVQPAASCTLTLSPPSVSVGAGAATITTSLIASGGGCVWAPTNNYPEALSISPRNGNGNGSTPLTFTLGANSSQAARTLTVPIGTATFTINQASTCTYSLTPSSLTLSAAGGSQNVIAVNTEDGCPWTPSVTGSFITITSPPPGRPFTGADNISYTVAANTGGLRSATISAGPASATLTQLPPSPYSISTLISAQLPATSAPGTTAGLGAVGGFFASELVYDANGNLYIASPSQNAVYELDTSGNLTRIAGTGIPGYSGDNGPAVSAQLNNPQALAVDSSGNIYICDSNNSVIREVSGGIIETVVGTGVAGFSGDLGSPLYAQLSFPSSIAVDSSGDLFVFDLGNSRIRKVSGGVITTIAGNGTFGAFAIGPATASPLSLGMLAVESGTLFFSDYVSSAIGQISGGAISSVAGTLGSAGFSGDGDPANAAQLNGPTAIAFDPITGDLYIADAGNDRIRKVSQSNGQITTVAGTGTIGFTGDGSAATSAELDGIAGVAVNSSHTLAIADGFTGRIRRVAAGTIQTLAGGATGDGGPAPFASLATLVGNNFNNVGVVQDSSGNLFVADGYDNRVRKITPAGIVSTVAGTGVSGYSGDGGAATAAKLNVPTGLAIDAAGDLWISDTGNDVVRKVAGATGIITTFAGIAGAGGYNGDNKPATSALFNSPQGLAVSSDGTILYIADALNDEVHKVSNGTITAFAGVGQQAGYNGDGIPATTAQLNYPSGLALDSSGNLYIADTGNARVRKVSGNNIATVAGNGQSQSGGTGDYGQATSASLHIPLGVAVDPSGNLYIADGPVRMVSASSGIISTIAGGGALAPPADGSPALLTYMFPAGIATDAAGNVYVSDIYANTIRLLTPGSIPALGIASSHSGSFQAGSSGQYTLTVSNGPFAGSTNGSTVTVTEIPPAGMTVTSMSGINWQCGTSTCVTNNTLSAGNSSFPITVNVSLSAAIEATQLTNQATVIGGGASMTGAEDLTLITLPTLQSIAVTPANQTIAKGQTLQFTAMGTYSNSTTANITSEVAWTTNPTGFASVNSAGLATGVSPGSTSVQATLGTVMGSIPLTVSSLAITGPSSLPAGQLDVNYPLTTVTATGATGQVDWSAMGLPSGLGIGPTTGIIGGVPSQNSGSPYAVQVSAADSTGAIATMNYTLTVGANPCAVTGDMAASVTDVQRMIKEAMGTSSPANDLDGSGTVNVVDVQRVIRAASGGVCWP